MKHKKIFLSLSLLIGLFSLSFCSSAIAWYNAPSGIKSYWVPIVYLKNLDILLKSGKRLF